MSPSTLARLRAPRALLLLIVLATVAATLGACKRRGLFRRRAAAVRVTPEQRERARHVARGRVHYLRYCALCHRADGSGYAADHANAVSNDAFLEVASDAFLRTAIADGRPGTPMSAWSVRKGGPLDDAMIDDLVLYLRSRARRPYRDLSHVQVTGDATAGGALFATHCQGCHGARGEGSATATSLAHPIFLHSASDGFIRHTIEHGRPGTPMQGFAHLGPRALDDLTAFVRAFEPRAPEPEAETVYAPPPGLENLVINPSGPAPRFTLREGRYVPAAEVARALQAGHRMVILDARAVSDWNLSHIPGALPFPFFDVDSLVDRLPRDGTWILAYCACPHAASGRVVDDLRRRRFRHTAVIDEGIPGWQAQGFPVAQGTVISGPARPPVVTESHGH